MGVAILKQGLTKGPLSHDPEWFNKDDNYAKAVQQALDLQLDVVPFVHQLAKQAAPFLGRNPTTTTTRLPLPGRLRPYPNPFPNPYPNPYPNPDPNPDTNPGPDRNPYFQQASPFPGRPASADELKNFNSLSLRDWEVRSRVRVTVRDRAFRVG